MTMRKALRVRGCSMLAAVLGCSGFLIGSAAGVGVQPAAALVTNVSGSAFGYSGSVGLFGGPRELRGAGSGVASSDVGYSPSVTLPAGGSATEVTADDPDGAKGVYGPAVIFGGIWPDNVATGPQSGPQSVSTVGTAADGSVTSSAHIVKFATPPPVGCAGGFPPPCVAPGGIGPGPLIAEEAHSTCTASEAGVTGSATFVNGKVETKYDESSQLPLPEFVVPMPNPVPPNWTISGTIDHVGDRFTIVLNEQIIGPNSITVNAAHMYLLGATARGEMVVGSSTCTITSTAANTAPVAADDAFTTAEDAPVVISAPGLLGNDSAIDGDALTATNAQSVYVPGPGEPTSSSETTWTFPSDPPNGTATIGADGSLTYTPDPNFFGTDTFKYVARDARGAWDDGVVTVSVSALPDLPVAADDADQTVRDTPLSVPTPGVLANDADGDGDALTAGSASDPPHGSVALNPDGSYTYTPDLGYTGPDSFTYVADDGTGRTDTATVTILVTVDGATLVEDINPGASSSSPGGFRAVGDTVFIVASDPATGRELWKTDGTPAGTTLVKDIRPGFNDGISVSGNITDFNGAVYFAASNGTTSPANGTELWKSDGTEAGTVMVRDINPGSPASGPTNFKAVGSTLYFTANNGSGTELWKTDGTTAGTVFVRDINTTTSTASSSPANLTDVNGTLFFTATNGTTTGFHGTEIWKSDGTTAGTVMVKDINVGTPSSSPTQLTAMGGTLFFRATNGATAGLNGGELWKSNGTAAGTVMVKDINVGTAASNPSNLTVWGDILAFSATDGDTNFGVELWKSDGTEAGTMMMANVNATGSASPNQLRVFGNQLLFSANGGTGANGFELWKTDGTEDGTVLVKDINPGATNSSPGALTVFGGSVYFSATTSAKGTELWKTDGTAAGTVMTEDINPGTASSFPSGLTPAFDTMLFSGDDAVNGTELWRLAPTNQAPVAADDTYTTGAGTPLTVAAPGVLANDNDIDSPTLTAGSASDPANGSVTLNPDGSFTYTPDPGFSGEDPFTYVIDDGDGGTDTGTVTITVTPAPGPPTLSVGNLWVAEGNSATTAATFTITRSGDTSGSTTVSYRTTAGNATAGTDYTAIAVATPVTFGPGEFSKQVTVDVLGDTEPEKTETFNFVLSAATKGTVMGDPSATATITNDDGAAFLSVRSVVVGEGNTPDTTPATFTVTRTGNSTATSSVTAGITGGSAMSGTDYTPFAQTTLEFAAGDTEKIVTVDVIGDATAEPNETFNLVLSAPSAGTVLADASGTAYIDDDDGTTAAPASTFFSVDSLTVDEGDADTNAALTVTRYGNVSAGATISFKTGGGTAIAGTDYTAVTTGQATFAPGQTSATVTVDVAGDTTPEKDETFNVTLFGQPTGSILGDAAATVTLVNDDGFAYVAVSNAQVNEGDSGTTTLEITVTRSGNTSAASTVSYRTSGGTATAGADYTAVALTPVTFAAGETTKTVTVEVAGDPTVEGNETFNLVLSAPSAGSVIADASGATTIVNDD